MKYDYVDTGDSRKNDENLKKILSKIKEKDIIVFKYKEDGAGITENIKIDEIYESGSSKYYESYNDKMVIILDKKDNHLRIM